MVSLEKCVGKALGKCLQYACNGWLAWNWRDVGNTGYGEQKNLCNEKTEKPRKI